MIVRQHQKPINIRSLAMVRKYTRARLPEKMTRVYLKQQQNEYKKRSKISHGRRAPGDGFKRRFLQ